MVSIGFRADLRPPPRFPASSDFRRGVSASPPPRRSSPASSRRSASRATPTRRPRTGVAHHRCGRLCQRPALARGSRAIIVGLIGALSLSVSEKEHSCRGPSVGDRTPSPDDVGAALGRLSSLCADLWIPPRSSDPVPCSPHVRVARGRLRALRTPCVRDTDGGASGVSCRCQAARPRNASRILLRRRSIHAGLLLGGPIVPIGGHRLFQPNLSRPPRAARLFVPFSMTIFAAPSRSWPRWNGRLADRFER